MSDFLKVGSLFYPVHRVHEAKVLPNGNVQLALIGGDVVEAHGADAAALKARMTSGPQGAASPASQVLLPRPDLAPAGESQAPQA